MQLRQAEEDQREAAAAADRMQKELAAAAQTRRAIDASFQRLDKARERTHAALSVSRPESHTGAATPSPIPATSAAAVLCHGSGFGGANSPRSALSTSAAGPRASSLGPVGTRERGCPGGHSRGPGFVQSDAGALSRELSRRESGWRERVVGRGEGVRWKHSLQGAGQSGSREQADSGARQSPNLLGASAGQTSFAERMLFSMQTQ